MVNPPGMRISRAQTVVLKFHSPVKESGLLGETTDTTCGEEMYVMSLELLVIPDNQEAIKNY